MACRSTASLAARCFLGFLLLTGPGIAEVYKYQDEDGCWHFTDKPPSAGADVHELDIPSAAKKSASKDLNAQLREKYEPKSPVEEATLAVVSIETHLGGGSGFFISNEGYILTSKHVVRPEKTGQWLEIRDNVERLEEAFQHARRDLDRERARLRQIENRLKHYKKAIEDAPSGYQKRSAEADYRFWEQRYNSYKKDYNQVKRRYDKRKKEFDAAKSDFRWKTNLATLARNFKIVLKDDSTRLARLVRISQEHDLALLQLEGCSTPFLEVGKPDRLAVGTTVYAIGSPIGLSDTVTSGIVTHIDESAIFTDATVLPGSSGGPLITKSGKVVGITTLRIKEAGGSEGFGGAIRIDLGTKEFKNRFSSD